MIEREGQGQRIRKQKESEREKVREREKEIDRERVQTWSLSWKWHCWWKKPTIGTTNVCGIIAFCPLICFVGGRLSTRTCCDTKIYCKIWEKNSIYRLMESPAVTFIIAPNAAIFGFEGEFYEHRQFVTFPLVSFLFYFFIFFHLDCKLNLNTCTILYIPIQSTVIFRLQSIWFIHFFAFNKSSSFALNSIIFRLWLRLHSPPKQ